MLDCIEITTAPAPLASVIWLHGLGADGSDFVPIVEELGLPQDAALRFVFPHAPLRPVTINGGYVMRAWYDIAGRDFALGEDEKGIRASQHEIEQLIARETERGIEAGNIVLAGFSQGGAVALQTGLRHAQRLAGIMALSAYLPLAQTLPGEAGAANRDTPVFMAHGTSDDIVPYALAKTSRERLLRLDYRVEWREYPMAHSVCAAEIGDIAAWLARVLPGVA